MDNKEVFLNKDKHYGVPDLLATGPASVKNDLVSSHPLEKSEKNYMQNKQSQEMLLLRKMQGLHAPLKLKMEQHIVKQTINEENSRLMDPTNGCLQSLNKVADQIGLFGAMLLKINRGPSLTSSNALYDALTGNDESIAFEDFLNAPEDQEVVGQPHALQERIDGLL